MKHKLRKEILEKRNSLSKEEITEKSHTISHKLESLKEFKKASCIMFYVSFGSEVITHDMIKKYLQKKNIVVPKVEKDKMNICNLKDFNELEKGYCNILEPKIVNECNEDIDIIIIPGIAFDKIGHRIGYGKGFYDDFLKNSKALKIALAFEMQLVDSIDADEWDEKVDIIVTEQKTYKITR